MHGRTCARGQGHGRYRRPSVVCFSMSFVYETIQEEGPGTSDPIEAPAIGIPVAVYNSVHSVHIANDSDSTKAEWNDERGIVAMRRPGDLKNEAYDMIMESKRVWLDTPFSLFAVQSFQPPHHPSGMNAVLEHSQQNYGPLPPGLHCRRVRSHTYSHPLPYPQRTIKPASPELKEECEMELLLPWLLENDGLRNLAGNSSCESDLYKRFSEIDEKSGAIWRCIGGACQPRVKRM